MKAGRVAVLTHLLLLAVLLLLLAVALANLADHERGVLRRLVHFPLYQCLLSLGLIGWLQRQGRRWLALTALLLAVGFGIQVAWLWKPHPDSRSERPGIPRLKVMTFNVFRENTHHSQVLQALKLAAPDVLYLTEMTPEWHQALEPMMSDYPHRLGKVKNLLLSRLPLEDARRVSVTFDAARSADEETNALGLRDELRRHWWNPEVLTARVRAKNGAVRLACVHSPTPSSDLSVTIQRACAMACRAEFRNDVQSDAQVMMGDLNTTCFSPTFRFTLEHTGLRDSARGFGYSPTWGPRLTKEPWLPWIGIPIDHILVSKNVRVLMRQVGPPVGSDHLWVAANLAWD